MKSRLLVRLESEIRSAPSGSLADCLRCERAAYLARHGDVTEATSELGEVRERHDASRPRLRVYAWLNLAEGLIGHANHAGPRVREKLARAHALSGAADLRPLRALASAWLGHLDYLGKNATGIAKHVAESLAMALPDHHGAHARAALVVAQSYDEGGRYDMARRWYARAHWHATEEGDDAALSAILWNMASLRVAAWRQAEASGSPATPGRHALASAESAALFDRLSGVGTRLALQPILRAQACTLIGRTDEALVLFEAGLAPALAQGLAPIEGVLLADRAWCRLRAGRLDAARADARAAATALALPGSHGERAPGHSRLAQVHAGLNDAALAREHQRLAVERWAGHRSDQARVVAALDEAVGGVVMRGIGKSDPRPS